MRAAPALWRRRRASPRRAPRGRARTGPGSRVVPDAGTTARSPRVAGEQRPHDRVLAPPVQPDRLPLETLTLETAPFGEPLRRSVTRMGAQLEPPHSRREQRVTEQRDRGAHQPASTAPLAGQIRDLVVVAVPP